MGRHQRQLAPAKRRSCVNKIFYTCSDTNLRLNSSENIKWKTSMRHQPRAGVHRLLIQDICCINHISYTCPDTNLRHCRKQNSSKNIKWKDIRDSYHQPRGGVQALCQSYYKCLSLSLYLSLPLSDFTCVLVLVFVFVIV